MLPRRHQGLGPVRFTGNSAGQLRDSNHAAASGRSIPEASTSCCTRNAGPRTATTGPGQAATLSWPHPTNRWNQPSRLGDTLSQEASMRRGPIDRTKRKAKSGVQILSPRLEIQELAALVRGELFLFEQQQCMLFFCLSFRFKQMPESRPLGRSSSVTSCSRTA